jgi:hypothetical protein
MIRQHGDQKPEQQCLEKSIHLVGKYSTRPCTPIRTLPVL